MTNIPLIVFWGTAVFTLMAALIKAGARAKVAEAGKSERASE